MCCVTHVRRCGLNILLEQKENSCDRQRPVVTLTHCPWYRAQLRKHVSQSGAERKGATHQLTSQDRPAAGFLVRVKGNKDPKGPLLLISSVEDYTS